MYGELQQQSKLLSKIVSVNKIELYYYYAIIIVIIQADKRQLN